MRLNKKYRLTFEDESSLQKKIDFTAHLPWFILTLIVLIIIAGAFGIFILASTPMKYALPGYLKESERTATEEQHLRLDSLVHVYEVNEAYVKSILYALNPPEGSNPGVSMEKKTTPLSADSLLPPSETEKDFMEKIRERDKYNVDYESPAAAQTMMFGSVNKSAVITEDSKEKYKAEILLPTGGTVSSIADGKVISIASNPRESGGYEVIIQHSKGFLSKSSHLTQLMVRPGDRVVAGQVIATGSFNPGRKANKMVLELWRDGDPLLPSRYLNGGDYSPQKNK